MNTTAVVRQSNGDAAPLSAATLEKVVIGGDLSALTPGERMSYYLSVCASVGLNPATRPFEYLRLNGKLVLYARKDATDQLRSLRGVSIVKLECEKIEDVYIVRAYAKDVTGREDVATGAVPIANLKGEFLSNAFLKCETKAKRRVTLSICGLGLLDETEVATISDARPVMVDTATGEVLGPVVDVAGAIEDQKAAKKAKRDAKAEKEYAEAKADAGKLLKELGERLSIKPEAWSDFVKSQKLAAGLPEKIEDLYGMESFVIHLERRLRPDTATVVATDAVPGAPGVTRDDSIPF